MLVVMMDERHLTSRKRSIGSLQIDKKYVTLVMFVYIHAYVMFIKAILLMNTQTFFHLIQTLQQHTHKSIYWVSILVRLGCS